MKWQNNCLKLQIHKKIQKDTLIMFHLFLKHFVVVVFAKGPVSIFYEFQRDTINNNKNKKKAAIGKK